MPASPDRRQSYNRLKKKFPSLNTSRNQPFTKVQIPDANGFLPLPQPINPQQSMQQPSQRLQQLAQMCSDTMDPISMEEFSDLSPQDLEQVVAIGSGPKKHCYLLENIMGHISTNIQKGNRVIDPLNPNHTITEQELAEVYSKMKQVDPTFSPPELTKKGPAEMTDLDRDAVRRLMEEEDRGLALRLAQEEGRLPQLRDIHNHNNVGNFRGGFAPQPPPQMPVFRFAADLPVQPAVNMDAEYEAGVEGEDRMDDPRLIRARTKVDAITKMPFIPNDVAEEQREPFYFQQPQFQPQPQPQQPQFQPQPQQPPFFLQKPSFNQTQAPVPIEREKISTAIGSSRQQVQPQKRVNFIKKSQPSKEPFGFTKKIKNFFSDINTKIVLGLVIALIIAFYIIKRKRSPYTFSR